MNEHLINLFSIDYFSLLAAVCTVMVASVAIKEGIEKFCKTFGIEFSWLRQRREKEECQKQIKEEMASLLVRQSKFEEQHNENVRSRDKFNKEIMNRIDELRKDINEMKEETERREAQKRFKKLRYDILNFANQVASMQQISAEMIDQIYDECKEYTKLSKDYGFENDRVDVSISVIKSRYEELLKEGKITRE